MSFTSDYAKTMAREISTASLAAAKSQLYADLHGDIGSAVAESERLLDEMVQGPDYAEGVRAWLERRPPTYG